MTLSPYLAHTETLFINLEILPLDKLIFKQDCNNDVYKLNDELKLISFHSYIILICCLQLCTSYTRKIMKFIPMALAIKIYSELIRGQKGLNVYLNSYSNISARLWKALVPKVNTSVSLPKFKSLLKYFLLFNTIKFQYPK